MYDIAFLGGGCTSLNFSMLYYFTCLQKKILILETKAHYSHDKNWSFWLPTRTTFLHDDIIKKEWRSWDFSYNDEFYRHSSTNFKYVTISSIDFYNKAINTINNDSRQDLIMNCRVEDVQKIKQGFKISSSQGNFYTKKIIDTRPPVISDICKTASYYQCFLGYEVRFNDNFFNDEAVGLMTNMKSDNVGMSFIYILPFSKKHGLIEYTTFGITCGNFKEYKRILSDYIKLHYTLDYDIEHTEKSILPMGSIQLDRKTNYAGYNYVGAYYGGLRSSSGYGFMNLYNWAKEFIKSIQSNSMLSSSNNNLTLLLDKHFIKTLKKYPTSTSKIFMKMARKIDPDSFVRFMDNRCSYRDIISMIKSVPKKEFIKSLFRS